MSNMFKPVETTLPAKVGFWSSLKSFLTVELTPHQQKIEDEINAFLYQEITWQKIHDGFLKVITLGKKNKEIQPVEVKIEE